MLICFSQYLKYIFASFNHIQSLNKHCFDGPENLWKLELQGNHITYFEGDYGIKLSNLLHLNISYNRMISLYLHEVDALARMQWLDLKGRKSNIF